MSQRGMHGLLVLRGSAVLLTLAGVITLGWTSQRTFAVPPVPEAMVRTEPAAAGGAGVADADSLIDAAITRTPFRAQRQPSGIAYDPEAPVGGSSLAPPPPPKPVLVVTGIVWGRKSEAVVEGLPGTTGGRLVRAGEQIGGVTVRGISRDQVTLAGFDTTWTLKLRTRW